MLARQFCLLTVLVLGMGIPTAVYANQRPSLCYVCTVDVVIVNVVIGTSGSSIPPQYPPQYPQYAFAISQSQLPVGMPFIIQFRVVYPIGTNPSGYPVTLSPPRASFSFTNSTGGSYFLYGVTVNPVPNQPGNYTYAFTVNSDFPQGVVTAAVVAGSLQDANGNIGPSATIASHNSLPPLDQTPSLYDNSILTVGPAQVIPPASINLLYNPPPLTYPSTILILILLTLILQVKIRRGRKTKTKKD